MVTGKYLVVDARGFIPSYHLVDSLKEVRAVLGAVPDPVKQLVFKAVAGCWVDSFGIVRMEIEEEA
jgi:hypothetical protein